MPTASSWSRLGALTKFYNIDKVLSMNRRTAESANLEYAASPIGRLSATLRAKLKGARERVFSPKTLLNPDPVSVGGRSDRAVQVRFLYIRS